jgi:hypothetical protein
MKKPFLKRTTVGSIDRTFSQKIVSQRIKLQRFSTNFAPIIATKRIIPYLNRLELIYALPYVVLRREILKSFYITKDILNSIKQIRNIFFHLEIPPGHYKYLSPPLSREASATTGIGPEKELAFPRYSVPMVTYLPPVVSLKPSEVGYYSFSFKPATTITLGLKTGLEKPREASLALQRSAAATSAPAPPPPYLPPERGPLPSTHEIISYFTPSREPAQLWSREPSATMGIGPEKELAFPRYQVPAVTYLPPVVSLKPSEVGYYSFAFKPLTAFSLGQKIVLEKSREASLALQRSAAATSAPAPPPPYLPPERRPLPSAHTILSYFTPSLELAQPLTRGLSTGEVEIGKNIYRTYPEIEHVASTHAEIIKERVIEKEVESKPPQGTPQLPSIDVNRLADQVYSVIERKIRIEKERRGFYS